MKRSLETVEDVARWRLCIGCGACASVCPQENIRLVDVVSEGIRPRIADSGRCASCRACLETCPSYELDHRTHARREGIMTELRDLFGPVLEIWEGHSADPQIRYLGSSGGALTALALYGLEKLGYFGALHTGADPEAPFRNKTRLSQTRESLLAATGSRYAPASVCDGLRLIEAAPAPCVFVGQPAEAAALAKARRLRPQLDSRVGLSLSFFCAGSPATLGTLELVKAMGIEPDNLASLRYRGEGWPGHFAPISCDPSAPRPRKTYRESWSFLQKFRPYGVHLWPDDTGEAADISCGDPWYQVPREGEAGSSLVVVRTEAGREAVRGAMAAGYLELTRAEPDKLLRSQENLSRKRRSVAGRRMAFRLCGLPLTRLRGFPLFRLWLQLPFWLKLKSFWGTLRRILARRYFLPLP